MGKLDLVGVFSGKEHFVKLPNGDEFYPVTIAYVTKEIFGGVLKADGKETTEAKFFKVNELPEPLNKKSYKTILIFINVINNHSIQI